MLPGGTVIDTIIIGGGAFIEGLASGSTISSGGREYVAGGFHLARDGHGGTAITYSGTTSAHTVIAASHT